MWRELAEKIRILPLVFWLFALPGLVLPLATGVLVKLYLQKEGRPTVSWSYFLDPLSILIFVPLVIFWAAPHIYLGLVATAVLKGRSAFLEWATLPQRFFVLGCAFVAGTIGLVAVFLNVFWEFDPLYIFVPLPAFYGAAMAFGGLVGYAIIRRFSFHAR